MRKTVITWGLLGAVCGLVFLMAIDRLAFGDIVPPEGCKATRKASVMTSSWYSIDSLKKEGTWKHSKGVMANGKKFKDEEKTCATRLWKIGTTLCVTNIKTKKSVIVKVTDKISQRLAEKRIDLSKIAFEEIEDLEKGLVQVKVQVYKAV